MPTETASICWQLDRLLVGGVDSHGTAAMGWVAKDWHQKSDLTVMEIDTLRPKTRE